MKWAEIKVATSDDAADLVSNILIEEGCGGVAITGPSVRASAPPELVDPGTILDETTITSYLPVDDRLEARLESVRSRVRTLPETGVDVGPADITVKPVEDADWAGAWKSFFKPVEIGRVLVKPSWEEVAARPDQVVVEIDPGMAFGTGNHPTTQLCALALQKYVRGGERVLDVGTGSGVLAISAARLGALEVTATEADPVAVEAACNNVARNSVEQNVRVIESDSLESVSEKVDIAVANITANTIIGLAGELSRAVAPGGILIASGLIEERADEVTSWLEQVGFDLIETMTEDDWVALILKRSLDRD